MKTFTFDGSEASFNAFRDAYAAVDPDGYLVAWIAPDGSLNFKSNLTDGELVTVPAGSSFAIGGRAVNHPIPNFQPYVAQVSGSEIVDGPEQAPPGSGPKYGPKWFYRGEPMRFDSPEHDPPHDTRPEAYRLFARAYFPVPNGLMKTVRANVLEFPADSVAKAWRACEWHDLQEINTVGEHVNVARFEDVKTLLPLLGTDLVRYSMKEGWVCRDYATAWAAAFVAFSTAAAGIVMDFSGEHSYNAIPVAMPMHESDFLQEKAPQVGFNLRWIVIEPQADQIVAHLDPPHHYVGQAGFVVLL